MALNGSAGAGVEVWTTEALVARSPQLAGIEVTPVSVPGPNGPVATRVYRSPNPVAALVWAHGGGFIFGDLDMPEAHWVSLTLATHGVTVCSVDYRKAIDGVHHPVPRDDVLAAWRWAAGRPAQLGTDAPVHLGGASAGGCLAASATNVARDRGEALPSSLVLVYAPFHGALPPASDELQRALDAPPPGTMLFDVDLMRRMAVNYTGDEAGLADPDVFPGYADHRGLPPTLIVNAECDILRASGEAYGADLAAAGNDVVVETEAGTIHGYINEPTSAGADRTLGRIASWITAR